MSPNNPQPGHNPTLIVAIMCCAFFWVLSKDPAVTPVKIRRELTPLYNFTRVELPTIPGQPFRTVRPVAESLKRMQQWVSALTAGVTLADLDGDGLPNDLLYTDTRTEQLVVMPAPGSTQRYDPFALAVDGYDRRTAGPSGVIVGDFNEDGLPDVLVHFAGRAPLIFLRKAPTAPGARLCARDFTPMELAPEIAREAWTTTTAVLADLDGDGHPDLLIGNYFPDWCDIYNPKEKRVQEMHNNNGWACNGGGIHFFLWQKPTKEYPYYFRQVKNLLPEKELHGWTLAIGAQDLTGDLLPEIYVGNDLGPDRMLYNRSTPGHLNFQVVEGESGFMIPGSFVMGRDKYKGMGCDFADLNGDGVPEIFISNVANEFALQESHFLWMSHRGGRSWKDGVAPYTQESERLGVSRGGWGWDAKFESFRNQVMPDLFQARGFIKGPVSRWPELQSLATYNSVFISDPRNWPTFLPGMDIAGRDRDAFYAYGSDGKYHDIGMDVGFPDAMVTRGVATGDVDGQGRVDLVVANMWEPSYYYRNNSPHMGHFLGLRVVNPVGRFTATPHPFEVLNGRPKIAGYPAFGAVAQVTLPCGRVLTREVDGGNGHAGRRSPELHFGLGELPDNVQTLDVKLRFRRADGSVGEPVQMKLQRDRWYSVVLGPINGKGGAQ